MFDNDSLHLLMFEVLSHSCPSNFKVIEDEDSSYVGRLELHIITLHCETLWLVVNHPKDGTFEVIETKWGEDDEDLSVSHYFTNKYFR